MTRTELAREWASLSSDLTDQIQILKLNMGLGRTELAQATRRLEALVARGDGMLAAFLGTESGPVSA